MSQNIGYGIKIIFILLVKDFNTFSGLTSLPATPLVAQAPASVTDKTGAASHRIESLDKPPITPRLHLNRPVQISPKQQTKNLEQGKCLIIPIS